MSIPIRVGVRAHDFGRLSAAELASKMAAQGLVCTQLALSKAIAGLDMKPGILNPGLAFALGQPFQQAGVQIAVLGCYINPIHPDPVTRRSLLGLFKEHLRYARDFGNGLVALETGSVLPDYAPHPDNQGEAAFRQAVNSFAELAAEAETCGVIVGIEAVTCHVVSSPAKMKRMLDAVASRNLQVVFDPVNLLSQENWRDQDRILKEALDLWGDRVAIVHAKDFVADDAGFRFARSGCGQLNHRLVMDFVTRFKPGVSIIMEETTEATAPESAQFLRTVAEGSRV